MNLTFLCVAVMVGVALAKPQGYDYPNPGYGSNDRQGYGGSGGGGGGYPDRQVTSQRPQQYTLGSELDYDDVYRNTGGGYAVFNRTDFYPNTAAVNRVQNFYPSSSPPTLVSSTPVNRFTTSSNDFSRPGVTNNQFSGSTTTRPNNNFQQQSAGNRFSSPGNRPGGQQAFGSRPSAGGQQAFGSRPSAGGQQFSGFGGTGGGFTSTTNRPGAQQQQPFANNFDRVTNTGFGATGGSGFQGNNPNFVTSTPSARPPFPDSINSQLPDSPVVNTNFPGNTGFVNSAVNTAGRPVNNNNQVPFGNNNGPSSPSRPSNNGGFGNGVTRPFTGNSNSNNNQNRPFNSNINNDRFGNNNNNNGNTRPFGGGAGAGGFGNNNAGFGNNNGGFGGGSGGFGGGNNNLGGFGGSNNNNNDDLSEPANYDFSYEVNDPPSGQNFGHSERRQGDDTVGSYFVLLPDGRLQRVEYTAGVGGYRARVTYEDQGGQFRK